MTVLTARKMELTGWALRPRVLVQAYRPEGQEDIINLFRHVSGQVIARGAGTSFGDQSLNEKGIVLLSERLNRFLDFDAATGLITVEGGVTLREILTVTLPHGWTLPVTPGTSQVSAAGCFACDVHGKNHHVSGSFSSHVCEFELLTPAGAVLRCSPDFNADIFWASAGGLGLTGFISSVTLQLRRVETGFMNVRYRSLHDLEATFAAIEAEVGATYSVAWVDCLARGRELGRSVLMVGEHTPHVELPAGLALGLTGPQPARLKIPFHAPSGLIINSLTISVFNRIYYGYFQKVQEQVVVPYATYFYPLDRVGRWNLAYGRRGFFEYQFAVPEREAFSVVKFIIETLADSRRASFLSALKRLGPSNPAQLSFPIEGMTLAVDIPAPSEDLEPMLRRFDERVAKAGGRVYLVKDSRLDRSFVDAMYPRRREWAEIAAQLDPSERLSSNLSRRLGLRT